MDKEKIEMLSELLDVIMDGDIVIAKPKSSTKEVDNENGQIPSSDLPIDINSTSESRTKQNFEHILTASKNALLSQARRKNN